MNVLDSIYYISAVWNEIIPDIIRNYFKNVVFGEPE